jgi:hypothetical protein
MIEKVKAVKKKPDGTSGSAEIYQTHSQARSNMINFGRFTSRAVQDIFFFKAIWIQIQCMKPILAPHLNSWEGGRRILLCVFGGAGGDLAAKRSG